MFFFGLNLPNYFDFITHPYIFLDDISNEFPSKKSKHV